MAEPAMSSVVGCRFAGARSGEKTGQVQEESAMSVKKVLGINGLGRIGKLTLWHHLAGSDFDRFVVNTGREVGTSLESVAQYLTKDSTYGKLHRWLGGHGARRDCAVIDESRGLLRIHGRDVTVLRSARNPGEVPWREHEVEVVVECTGKFVDHHAEPDASGGSLRGHLAAGARTVIISAPFKTKKKNAPDPDDSIMMIYGINHHLFEPGRHTVISSGSCTTTALAHMMKPLLEKDLTRRMITAGMSTVHALTPSQHVLDAVPGSGAKDLRKTRSGLVNVVLTSTGAAKALEQVLPGISRIGFMADSVRVPTSTVSLIILNITFQTDMTEDGRPMIDRDSINQIYREAAQGEAAGLLEYSEEQNVSADLQGENAAVVIEAVETHTRTGFVDIEISSGALGAEGGSENKVYSVPVTHVNVFGWYDNELGSYTHRLGELTSYVASML